MRLLLIVAFVALLGLAAAKPSGRDLLKRLERRAKAAGDNQGNGVNGGGQGGQGGQGNQGNDESDESEESGDDVQGYAAMLGGDFVEAVKEMCGFDLTEAELNDNPVTEAEVVATIAQVRSFASTLKQAVSGHSQDITDLENQLADPATDPAMFVAQHGDLLEKVGGTVESMSTAGMCAMATLIPVRMRMELIGVSGFKTTSKCNRLGIFLLEILQSNAWDFQASAEELFAQLEKVGLFLRQDVQCLVDDINDYEAYVATVQVSSEMSARQAILTVDGMGGYLTDIGTDVTNLMASAEGLGYMLGAQAGAYDKKKELRTKLKKLVRLLEDMKQ